MKPDNSAVSESGRVSREASGPHSAASAPLFRSLRIKLLRMIVLVSALFTLLVTWIQLEFEYRTDLEMLNHRIESIQASHLPPLELSIYTLDSRLIMAQLESLQALPDVHSVSLSTRYGEDFKIGDTQQKQNLKRYTLDIWSRDAQPLELGTLVLFSDLDVIYEQVFERGKVMLATLGLRTFFVSLGILYLVHFLVTRHLAELARYLKHLNLSQLDEPFEIKRSARHVPDEFDTIVGALNHMRETLRSDVDALESMRHELQAKEQKYRLAINATRDGLWDWQVADGSVEYSRGWAEILGEQTVPSRIETWQSRLHPNDEPRVMANLQAHLTGKMPTWREEHRLRDANGDWVWVLGRGEVVERGQVGEPLRMIGTMSDINARKLSEQAQRDAEEKIKLLLNSTAEAIYGMDVSGRCIFVNPSCVRMLGYSSEDELVGENIHEMIHHTTRDGQAHPIEECQIYQAVKLGEGNHSEEELFWRKDGSSIPVEYWSYPMLQKGQTTGAVVTFLDITARLEDKRKLEHLATHDSLTGVANRKHFEERLQREFGRAQRYQHELSLIMIDLDHFKQINDSYGHLAGDEVLQRFAEEMKQSIRQHDCAGRYGGEEFVILLPETSLRDAIDFAQRLREKVAQLDIAVDAQRIKITASFGVASFPENAENPDHLLMLADQAMYAAKQAGRNRVSQV